MPEAKRSYRKGYVIRRRPEKDTIGLGYRVRLSTKKKIEMIAYKNKISQAEVIELLVDKVENDCRIETGMFKVKKKDKLPEPQPTPKIITPPKPDNLENMKILECSSLPSDSVYLLFAMKRSEVPKRIAKVVFT